MAAEFIILCKLLVDGRKIATFKSVTEHESVSAKEIKYVGGTGFANVTPSFAVDVDYIVPSDKNKSVDFSTVKDGTLVIIDDGGQKTTYTGVRYLGVGEVKREGENEVVKPIKFGATGKI